MKRVMTWLLLLMVSSVAWGAEMDGVKFPDQIRVDATNLVLNGLGMRRATFLHVKVYVGALYVQKKSHDAGQILDSPEVKRVVLAFVRDVNAEQIRDAWNESLKNNCSSDCGRFKAPMDELKSKMRDMKNGQQMAFDVFPNRVDVMIQGKKVDTIKNSEFPKQFLKVWLGNPPNEELKKGMLGQ